MPRLLLTGASGRLGAYILQSLSHETSWDVVAWSSSKRANHRGVDFSAVDLRSPQAIRAAFATAAPELVIHAAAISSIAQCAADPDQARRVNVDATAHIASLARERAVRLVYLSTDLVFDGERSLYSEEDSPGPVSHYGRTKLDGEKHALDPGNSVVIRLAHLFGPSLVATPTSYDTVETALRGRTPLRLFTDEWRSPLDFKTAAAAILRIAIDDFAGLIHLGGPERMSRWEMGLQMADCLALDPSPLVPDLRVNHADANSRPRDVSFDSSRVRALFPAIDFPDFRTAVTRWG